MANIDEKIYNSYPDGFDVVKVTAKTTAGDIIYENDIYTVTAKASTGSRFIPDLTVSVMNPEMVMVIGLTAQPTGVLVRIAIRHMNGVWPISVGCDPGFVCHCGRSRE